MFGNSTGVAIDARQMQAYHPPQNSTAPKELGIIQRVEGLAGGLEDLQSRLENFIGRCGGGCPPQRRGFADPERPPNAFATCRIPSP